MDAREVRREKTKVLAATRLGTKLIFGQYDRYRLSQVSILTVGLLHFAGTFIVDNWSWEGVPFNFLTGKKIPYQCVEVVIKLKAPPLKLYEGEINDRIVIRLQPILILILVWTSNLLGLMITLN